MLSVNEACEMRAEVVDLDRITGFLRQY